MDNSKLKDVELNSVEIGRLGKPYGYSGAIHVYLDDDVELLDDLKFLFVSIEGLPVPFRVTEQGSHNGILTVILDRIDSKEGIEVFKNAKISVEAHCVSIESSKSNELIGYTVIDHHKVIIGKIVDIIEQDPLLFLKVRLQDLSKEIIIPFHDDLLLDMSQNTRTLTIEIADGLLHL